jgi:hypothetical protein
MKSVDGVCCPDFSRDVSSQSCKFDFTACICCAQLKTFDGIGS